MACIINKKRKQGVIYFYVTPFFKLQYFKLHYDYLWKPATEAMCSDIGDAPFNICNTVELISKRKFETQFFYLRNNFLR